MRLQLFVSSVKLEGEAPKPYCCIRNKADPNRGIIPHFYNAGSGPIVVLDEKTLLIPNFSFTGSQPPDGYIFAGKGVIGNGKQDVVKATGKKAIIVGRDTEYRQCPIREDYDGRSSVIVRLAPHQTIYDVNYITVFCYEFAVDFGHVTFDLKRDRVIVPLYIPQVGRSPQPPSQSQC